LLRCDPAAGDDEVDEEVGGFSVVGVDDILAIGGFSLLFVIIVVLWSLPQFVWNPRSKS
jgi:hypothetical protein